MLKVNAVGMIDPIREMHYAFHHKVDAAMFPQVHDFYEISLVTEGAMEMEINSVTQISGTGMLILIRPGDIHDRREISGGCSYINLAFPDKIVKDLFRYLDMPDMPQTIMDLPDPPQIRLLPGEARLLQMQLKKLNLCPVNLPHVACRELRRLVLDIMLQHFVPALSASPEMACPHWLSELVRQLENPDMLSAGLDELAAHSGCTKEHLCRDFRKYLGVSPMAYVNAKRLNYAANLLRHSDQKVIDIAYDSGFQSLSCFYHAFKKEFRMSALEYRQGRGN
ncbi:AraC family transcriptional regulator [Clostridium sp. AN503]|uniref:helix-turn-helix transcriptional regulator n=1 Tax=Clostridium sp. AN503 TaxID=3160598 RepID=UPI003459EE44